MLNLLRKSDKYSGNLAFYSLSPNLLINTLRYGDLCKNPLAIYTRPKKKRRYFIKKNMQLLEKLEQNCARECSLPVSQFIKTLVLPRAPKFDVNTAPKYSSIKRWEVGVLNTSLEMISHSLSPDFWIISSFGCPSCDRLQIKPIAQLRRLGGSTLTSRRHTSTTWTRTV